MARINTGAVIAVALTSSLAQLGCTSDGQVGETGLVRFSQFVHFAETDDFSAPVAVGSSLMVALQSPGDSRLGDEPVLSHLHLEVQKDDKKVGNALPLGVAQFAVGFESDGPWKLVAKDGETAVDAINLTVAPLKTLRFGRTFQTVTHDRFDEHCVQSETHESPLSEFVLSPNQVLTVAMVPEDSDANAMLGLLPLTARVAGPVTLDTPLAGHGSRANTLVVRPQENAFHRGESVTLTVKEETTGLVAEVTIKITTQPARARCGL